MTGSFRNDEIKRPNDDYFRCLLINARSVMPKLASLTTTMDEMEADVTCVTETWTRPRMPPRSKTTVIELVMKSLVTIEQKKRRRGCNTIQKGSDRHV